MKRCRLNRFIGALAITLISTAGLYGLSGTTPANAGIWPGLTQELCMADAYLKKPGNSLPQGALNCTANDVEITKVTPLDPNAECTTGEVFTFQADIEVRTNANERWDTTFYLPLTTLSPQVVQNGGNNCSLLLPKPDDEAGQVADVQLDGDQCGDISKAFGSDTYTLSNESVTMLCTPSTTDPTKAEFTYCAAWDNQTGNNCTANPSATPYPGQIPSTKSKCNCDSFPINVFIRPPAPDIIKSEGSPTTRSEAGGEYTFNVSFTNPSSNASLFITSLTDEIDIGGEGTYDKTVNLWGALDTVQAADGVYLVASNCTSGSPYEVGPSGTYSCSFTVHIKDTDLPDDQSPELYKDAIKVVLEDKNGDPVVDGGSCTAAGLTEAPGEHCSVVRTVQVTNVAPSITVTKTPSVDEVLEPGGNVTFDVVVTSTSGTFDDPLTLSELTDSDFGSLAGKGDCAVGGSLYLGSPYTCSFTEFIAGNAGDVHSNTLTAKAVDNEQDEAQASDSATVNINDVPSLITLEKTANPIEVDETGDDASLYRNVAYTFLFSVDSNGVDDVTFSSLTDVPFGTLTGDCSVTMKNGNPIAATPLLGFVLQPGENASCVITKGLQGDAGDTHLNTATISGTDEDGQPVSDSDDATVTFLDTGLDIEQEFALKATAFVRITNGSVENATITGLTLKGINLVAGGTIAGQFEILDEAATSSYQAADGPYAFCATGAVIAPSARYDCAFTVKLLPGFEAGDISFLATGADGLVVTLEDNEGNPVNTNVDISIATQE